jgi:hypothetical protein
MGKEPNWHRQTAISGWANALLGFVLLGVTLWLGLREPATAQSVKQNVTAGPAIQQGPTNQEKSNGDGPMMHSWAIWVASIYGLGIVGAALLHYRAAKLDRSAIGALNGTSKLIIHSARYGTEASNYQTVSEEVLRRHDGGAMSVYVSDNLVPFDPVPGVLKHLEVEYSYGHGEQYRRQVVTRGQNQLLILPEDRVTLEAAQQDLIKQMDATQKLAHEIERLKSNEYSEFWQRIGAVRLFSSIADMLNHKLEEIWHLWNNTGGDKLIYPLSSAAIPDPELPLSWNLRQLLEFRILYRWYIAEVKVVFPDFHSNLIDDGFPCDMPGQEYLHVKHKIYSHSRLLLDRADRQIQSLSKSEKK